MITIIIPTKNHRVVENLLNKLVKIHKPEKVEIIVVDASNGKLNDIRDRFMDVRWLDYKTDKQFSVADQRNFGILNAKGDIIVFIDADCIPHKNWLLNLIKPIRTDSELITASKIISLRKYPTYWNYNYEIIKSQKYIAFATTMGMAVKRSVFNKTGNYDITFEFGGEDTDMCFRINNSAYKIRYVKDARIYHDWGSINRNIYRCYIYGKAHFKVFLKYPKKTFIEALSYIFYFLYLSLLLITYFYNIYIVVLVVLFVKKALEVKSISYATQIFVYKYLVGLGFIMETFYYIRERLKNLLSV